nr:TRAP transporter small permease [Lysobacter sp. CAU 1642]
MRRAEDALLGGLLLGLVLLSSVQIFRRALFHEGWIGAEAAGRGLVLWIALLGALAATREGRHVRIDLAAHRLGSVAQAVLDRLAAALASAFCAVMGWLGWQLLLLEQEMGEVAFAGVPAWWISAVIPLGFGFMALRFALQVFFGPPPRRPHP